MKTILFTYESPAGTFWMTPEPAGRVQLGIDRHKLKTYASPRTAARDVARRSTGWEPWDTLDGPVPAGLNRWKRPAQARQRKAARAWAGGDTRIEE